VKDAIADMFANRVRKNARHLAKWARRTAVTCWRVYDRDIPEVPVTLDTYAGALVLNDYRLEQDDDAWLDAVVAAARAALEGAELFVKQRERRRGRAQYDKLAGEAAWRVVTEGGHRFRVNLSDYVDTGLFLDHRVTRARVAGEGGASLLNLFAYTGAFSVYAAAAGAKTTSVDLSKTYLDWAHENLALNRLTGELVHADVRAFLAEARRARRRWDVAIVDAPTFSNSKRADHDWDVQRDHAALVDAVRAVTGRVVWLATNRKRFKLEAPGFTDETTATTPPDFRHRPHFAFRSERATHA
jgi:23S rRNA G2069 N7-methylase RlmK/C1962 C5-methylase RlmI